jgi:hypothetical protein
MFITSERASPSGESIIEITAFGLINALLFALPQFIWLAATALFRVSWRVCDAGLVAADVVLLVYGVLVTFRTDLTAGSGMWYLEYLPVAIIASVLAGIVARLSAPKGLTSR